MQRIDVDILGRPAFSVIVDVEGSYRYDGINSFLARLSGFTRDGFIGRMPRECMPAEAVDTVMDNYRRCFETATMQEYEERLDVPAGTKWWRTTLSPVLGSDGDVVQILGLCVDITERKAAERDIRSAAFTDSLTGICNRRAFERDLEEAVVKANDTGRPFWVIVADVDRFKSINDTHGHGVGDAVLKEVANRLTRGVRKDDRRARIGGDEFAAIIAADNENAVLSVLDRLQREFSHPVAAGSLMLAVGVSVGAASWSQGMSASDVMGRADAAMYDRKIERAA